MPRGVEHGRVGAAVRLRRRAQHDLGAAGDLRRYAEHQRGRGQRGAAGRHVQADPLDRQHRAFQHQTGTALPGQRLRLGRLVVAADAIPRALDRGLQRGRQTGLGGGELGLADGQLAEFSAVEAAGQRAQRRVAIGADLFEDPLDLRAAFGIGGQRRAGQQLAAGSGIQRGPGGDRQHIGISVRSCRSGLKRCEVDLMGRVW